MIVYEIQLLYYTAQGWIVTHLRYNLRLQVVCFLCVSARNQGCTPSPLTLVVIEDIKKNPAGEVTISKHCIPD